MAPSTLTLTDLIALVREVDRLDVIAAAARTERCKKASRQRGDLSELPEFHASLPSLLASFCRVMTLAVSVLISSCYQTMRSRMRVTSENIAARAAVPLARAMREPACAHQPDPCRCLP